MLGNARRSHAEPGASDLPAQDGHRLGIRAGSRAPEPTAHPDPAVTVPLRPCLDCGTLVNGTRCASCKSRKNRARDQARGSSTARGYDRAHETERLAWVPLIATGTVRCRRAPSGQCVAPSPLIRPDEAWHLGHPDAACPAPKAPEHVICNVGAPRRQSRRTVVLLCGPAGAGKTTVARASGLTVYDRDDPEWTSERQFTQALARLATDPHAQAVVIRSGATSSARARASRLINATHVFLLLADPQELERRIRERNRADKVAGVISVRDWFARFDRDDQVVDFPGWRTAL